MPEPDDITLLKEYAESDSEAAFATLAGRHVNLVYSVALRRVVSTHAAEEITQAVFIILARKAKSLGSKTVLSSWLYQTARLTAANHLRKEIRRQRREQEAYMESLLKEPESDAWRQIAPLLDDALGRLGTKDRNAIVLRYFENRNLREVGAALGTNESAAKMRVNRALEKLRKFFTRRGVVLTAAILAGAVSTNSVHAAPAGLAETVSAVGAAKGVAAASSILTLAKGALKSMAWTKAKTGLVVVAAAAIAGAVATPALKNTLNRPRAVAIAQAAETAYSALSSYSDTGKATIEGVGPRAEVTFSTRLQRPNLYRIEWQESGGSYPSKGTVWSDGKGDFVKSGPAGQYENARAQQMHDMQFALAAAGATSGSAASTIPAAFFNIGWDNALGMAASGNASVQKEKDERIGNVDCYVIDCKLGPTKVPARSKPGSGQNGEAQEIGPISSTLWIGKQDHLIRQVRVSMETHFASPSQAGAVTTDAKPKTILKGQNKERPKTRTIVFVQTHEHIVVNQKFVPTDFVPAGI